MIITMQIVSMTNVTCLGIQEAACVLVGNQIGAMNVNLAKRYARYTFVQAYTVAGLVSLFLFVYRYEIVTMFTQD